ncbi:hypothetical protein [Denitromonas halophila]|uniref:Uncharacterized protein n=1 Tax=Denitromonas halophila TaxID=1629404 RepID=A0A557QLQ7_9RHOO|nr:hypothetical protein [Denitromonas halophila]TVO53837.1 hypothetical protein FHP91_13650 [Denitromonas halophila]
MELNLTAAHLAGFVCMVWIGAHFIGGARLVRWCLWAGMWQLTTVVMPAHVDIPACVALFALCEYAFAKLTGGRRHG